MPVWFWRTAQDAEVDLPIDGGGRFTAIEARFAEPPDAAPLRGIQAPGRQLFTLQGLPGIGRQRALRLLEALGSVEAVIRAGADELQAVPGIGAKTAARIRWTVSEPEALYGENNGSPI